MPIGEFGGAPPLVAAGSPALTTPMYWMYEMAQASLNPARAITDATKILFQNPLDLGKAILPPVVFRSQTDAPAARAAAAGADRRPDVRALRHLAARHGRSV